MNEKTFDDRPDITIERIQEIHFVGYKHRRTKHDKYKGDQFHVHYAEALRDGDESDLYFIGCFNGRGRLHCIDCTQFAYDTHEEVARLLTEEKEKRDKRK